MKNGLLFALMLSLTFSVFANGERETADMDVDSVTTASPFVNDGDALVKALGSDGNWIVALQNDISVKGDILVEGDVRKPSRRKPYRKIALHSQDRCFRVTNRFNLTADKLIVRSEHTRIKSGTFIGDVFVDAMDFELKDAKVIGNVYFKTDEQMKSFRKDKTSEVTGTTELEK